MLKEAARRYDAAGTPLLPEELSNRVNQSLKRASDLLGLSLPTADDNCESDYSAFCPEGWVSTGDGIHCVLPYESHSNSGLCGRQLDMHDKSALDKLNLAETCDLKWPCLTKEPIVPKSDDVCPKFWRRNGDQCLADATYVGPCNMALKFTGKSHQERQNEARICRLNFSKTTDLLDENSDWSADCPLGWSLQDDGTCAQNLDQSVSQCGRKLKFTSIREKREKAKRCSLVWPIKTEKVESFCPLGWQLDADNELCLAPASYMGPCQLRMDFSQYTAYDKAMWAHACGVSFLDEGEVSKPPKSANDVFYRNGPVDHSLAVVGFGKPVKDVRVMERQLDELNRLRKKSSDPLFIRTVNKSIATLRSHIKSLASGASFLQVATMALTPNKRSCPYGWRQFDSVCIASEAYHRVVPGCKTVHRISDEFNEQCRVSMRIDDHRDDFVRAHCPLGWRIRQVYFANLVRHICIAPSYYKESQRIECGGGTVDFSARSPGFKRRWSFSCGQRFPDFEDAHQPKCVENFFWHCPSEWQRNEDSCLAPEHYVGPCPPSVRLSEIGTESSKASFSKRCLAAWPCLGNCEKDYSRDCPDGWDRNEDLCTLATPGDGGRCGKSIEIRKPWNDSHKEEVEFLCGVHWPCHQT
ncbi:uncharacterized protein BXIN_2294 [Babesia sp. Xinjiang]|uniref:uncharacterized protein n=1 Tax=Babesia sp. Xinjiang TaxID=462227 RepID=UPI000A248CA3|nr:uncharacterized protein BXIN_2294 [Babesia sp. Xinjiang]ORM40686.1 hypothetical protein BXIN_2294 [Babesia sp. Xinjiang]